LVGLKHKSSFIYLFILAILSNKWTGDHPQEPKVRQESSVFFLPEFHFILATLDELSV
jgi:hypothetical protein